MTAPTTPAAPNSTALATAALDFVGAADEVPAPEVEALLVTETVVEVAVLTAGAEVAPGAEVAGVLVPAGVDAPGADEEAPPAGVEAPPAELVSSFPTQLLSVPAWTVKGADCATVPVESLRDRPMEVLASTLTFHVKELPDT